MAALTKMNKSKSLKKQIRDTERLLNRGKSHVFHHFSSIEFSLIYKPLPATLQQEQERRLKALQLEAQQKASSEKEKKLAVKYKMVKFVEMKKVNRKLASLRKQAPSADVSKEIKENERRLNYIQFYPKNEKYIALFPKEPILNEKVLKRQQEIMDKIDADLSAKAASAKMKQSLKRKNEESDDEESSQEYSSDGEGSFSDLNQDDYEEEDSDEEEEAGEEDAPNNNQEESSDEEDEDADVSSDSFDESEESEESDESDEFEESTKTKPTGGKNKPNAKK